MLKSWRINIPKTTFRESGRTCSRSISKNTEKSKRTIRFIGTIDVYRYSWEFYAHLQFTDSICDDTDDTIDTIAGPSSAKKRKKQRDDIENKKLELFEQAVVAIKAPLPAIGDSPAHETNEAHVFGKYVGLTLSKRAPTTFRRAKKCISDVLFELEKEMR